MKKFCIVLLWLTFFSISPDLISQYRYPYLDGIPIQNYALRRQKLINQYPSNTALLLLSPEFFMNSSEADISSNLYYLSGMPQQKAILLLSAKGVKIDAKITNEILFLKIQSGNDIVWNGYLLDIKNAENLLQIQKAMDISDFDSMITQIFKGIDTIYIDKPGSTKHFSSNNNSDYCEAELLTKIKEALPDIIITENIPAISKMRRIKDKDEIRLMQKAVDISVEGHIASMKAAKPGITEYQLQAEMEYQFCKNGAESLAYGSIVGSGINSCFLHYHSNRDTTVQGALVLMDCGAKYHGYSSDLTRTFPVNGKFTKEQKIIYNIVLEAMDSAFSLCKSGNKFRNIHSIAKDVIKKRLLEQSIISNPDDVDDYFPHGTSHFIGIDVHESSSDTLEPGNIFTVEPGIYIPEGSPCDKRWWNIGIRIEDDILITNDGFINLSEKLPRKPNEIEMLME